MFPKSFGANDTLDNVGMISKLLEMKIRVLMVYGMKDTTCNYEGAGIVFRSATCAELVVLKDSPIAQSVGVGSGQRFEKQYGGFLK